MSIETHDRLTAPSIPPPRPSWRVRARAIQPELITCGLVLAVLARSHLQAWFETPWLANFATVFVAVVIQALPFLVLGVALSACIAAFVPSSFFVRALPSSPVTAVPIAATAGAVLPGCECASVPVAGGLISRGVRAPVALAFLLSAPAINPLVLVSTAVAFPGHPEMVLARFVASLVAAVAVGWLWTVIGRSEWIRVRRPRPAPEGAKSWRVALSTASHDFIHTAGYLVIGALTAAALNTLVPRRWLDLVAGHALVSVLALAALAVVLAICSEADAFVASSLTQFSLTARLAFLVVGPMVDVKLIALQTGTFGAPFARRFAPLTFVVAVTASLIVGWWLL